MRTLCALLGVLCLSLAAGGRPVCALSFPFQEEGVELSIEPASGLEAGATGHAHGQGAHGRSGLARGIFAFALCQRTALGRACAHRTAG